MGVTREILGRLLRKSRFKKQEDPKYRGFPPILNPIDSFYSRRLYFRFRDAWNRPIASPPGSVIDVIERDVDPESSRLVLTDRIRKCINLGSYNYLGISGDTWKATCQGAVLKAMDEFGTFGGGAGLAEGGMSTLHRKMEKMVAEFVGKEDAVVFSMGYGTNSTNIPCLMHGPGSLLVSDSLNHTSIVNGARGSGAIIRVFRHNSAEDLDKVLANAIAMGQPRTHLPWKKIMVMTEGIFSMEGEICNLKPIVEVCKKYKAYLYVDEAHSIGALGKSGKGVCEHTGVDPKDVDILMGTFTKSFGAMGGYIASSKAVCDYLRTHSLGATKCSNMSPVVCAQIMVSIDMLMGRDGTTIGRQKLDAIKRNANYFRKRLEAMGCEVLGDEDSPVIPIMLYIPSKIGLFSRLCFERNLAVVVVGFPAVPLNAARTRICISAGHTQEQLDEALAKIEDVVGILRLRYKVSMFG